MIGHLYRDRLPRAGVRVDANPVASLPIGTPPRVATDLQAATYRSISGHLRAHEARADIADSGAT